MKQHPLEALCEQYLYDQNFTRATLKSYRIVFKYYIIYLKENNISYAKTSDIIKYRENLRNLGYSTHYIHIHVCALRGLYRYLRINQKRFELPIQYAYDVMIPIKNERIHYHINKPILTLEQAKHLILHTKKMRKSIWHYRDHAIIFLMITTGLRRIEVIQAKREDYQKVNGKRILYIGEKENHKRDQFVHITPGVESAIDAYLNKRKDHNPYLFVTTKNVSPKQCLSRTFFRYMFKRVLKDCGLDGLGITPHALRHTAGMMNLLRGGSVEATKCMLRHANIQSTYIYQDYLNRLNSHTELEIENYILKEEASNLYKSVIAYLES